MTDQTERLIRELIAQLGEGGSFIFQAALKKAEFDGVMFLVLAPIFIVAAIGMFYLSVKWWSEDGIKQGLATSLGIFSLPILILALALAVSGARKVACPEWAAIKSISTLLPTQDGEL